MDAEEERPLLSAATERAFYAARSASLPEETYAIFARWWQLETWLRELVYVELRSLYGSAWQKAVAASAGRQRQDAQFQHMSSADSDNPLAYLDYSQLLKVIAEHDDQLRYALLEPRSWAGRQDELMRIRHRIGHMRKPHSDDLGRLEQTLRDLERGAFIACASYNRRSGPDPDKHSDPVTQGWLRRQHPTALRLIDHAEARYDTSFELTVSRRPWATYPDDLDGAEGIFWHASFYIRRNSLEIKKLWRQLQGGGAPLVHLVSDDPGSVHFTFSAVDGGTPIAEAIGRAFDAVLMSCRVGRQVESDEDFERWQRQAREIDYRVVSGSHWSIVDETTVPISMFGAGGGIDFPPQW
ncbi:conserved hypothetical protein [Catenulispora acidiphila DSM 44928]|uniref:Uncharacterized protein n=1 Tax=Catenulispora acidiphila (strain DSM 44928 / JCM 14897 / NBRC 102108 / NRRL B-24433 / ID139908) TaxID=479433 RepID=C7Q5L3_CATAD|nr:Swt1 family HEPN domain-containing protein [Catenulispora acidiphila]ACU77824.1 conserved hypothetical protein [Catenulispora acidiphila DSM 44928]